MYIAEKVMPRGKAKKAKEDGGATQNTALALALR